MTHDQMRLIPSLLFYALAKSLKSPISWNYDIGNHFQIQHHFTLAHDLMRLIPSVLYYVFTKNSTSPISWNYDIGNLH